MELGPWLAAPVIQGLASGVVLFSLGQSGANMGNLESEDSSEKER